MEAEEAIQKIIEFAKQANIPGLSIIFIDQEGQISLEHYGRKRNDRLDLIDDQTVYTLRSTLWETPEDSPKQKFIKFGMYRLPTQSLLVMGALREGKFSLTQSLHSFYQDHPDFPKFVGDSEVNWTVKQYLDDDRRKDYSLMPYDFERFGDFKKGFRFADILVQKLGYKDVDSALKELVFDPVGVPLPSFESYYLHPCNMIYL